MNLNLTYVPSISVSFVVKLNLEILVNGWIFVLKLCNYATDFLLTNWLNFLEDFSDLTFSLDCFPYSAWFHWLWFCPPNGMTKPLDHSLWTSNGCNSLFHSKWFFVLFVWCLLCASIHLHFSWCLCFPF